MGICSHPPKTTSKTKCNGSNARGSAGMLPFISRVGTIMERHRSTSWLSKPIERPWKHLPTTCSGITLDTFWEVRLFSQKSGNYRDQCCSSPWERRILEEGTLKGRWRL